MQIGVLEWASGRPSARSDAVWSCWSGSPASVRSVRLQPDPHVRLHPTPRAGAVESLRATRTLCRSTEQCGATGCGEMCAIVAEWSTTQESYVSDTWRDCAPTASTPDGSSLRVDRSSIYVSARRSTPHSRSIRTCPSSSARAMRPRRSPGSGTGVECRLAVARSRTLARAARRIGANRGYGLVPGVGVEPTRSLRSPGF